MDPKMIRRFLDTVALAAIMVAGPMAGWALNGKTGVDESMFIQRFDQDGDDLISAYEFPGDENQFSRLDINGDHYIDATEAPRRPPPGGFNPEDMLAEFDADEDGRLSPSEFPGPADHFNRMDTDGDGLLSDQELLAGRPPGPGFHGFEKDDADQDGKVSRDEFSGPADLFDRLDADGDGYITREEVRPRCP